MSEQRSFGQTLLSLATLLVTVVGAGVALLEYRGAQDRERVERVFRYSDTLAGEVVANERINALGDQFIANWPTLAASTGDKPSPERLKALTDEWFVNVINGDPDLRSAVDRMALFYDTLSVCVAANMCDEKTAKALFTQQAAAFASTVYPWVAYRNKDYLAATGIQAMCLRNRFCGGQTDCPGLPSKLASCQ